MAIRAMTTARVRPTSAAWIQVSRASSAAAADPSVTGGVGGRRLLEIGLRGFLVQAELGEHVRVHRLEGHRVGVAIDDVELLVDLGAGIVEAVVALECRTQVVRHRQVGGRRGSAIASLLCTAAASSSSPPAVSNCQARIASRIGRGSDHPAASTTDS